MSTVGIIGQGFVGSAIREGLKSFYKIYTYDIKRNLCNCNSLGDLTNSSNFIFICLPTPMKEDGSCSTKIVEETARDIDTYCQAHSINNRIVIIKSTVPPGTTQRINAECKNVSVVFSPEFLTEANSFNDFKNQKSIIIGGDHPASSHVKMMLRKAFSSIPIIKTNANHAEMVKYFINCFLSTKLSFSNEMYQLCEKINVDYDKVIEYVLYDDRLGKSHFSVPGPDGHAGFGGHCFPKDLSAMITIFRNFGVQPTVLEAVREKNDEVRDDRDWERMKGRAVL